MFAKGCISNRGISFNTFKIARLNMTHQNTDWQGVRKGTLQHEIFWGESAVVWDEDTQIVV